MVSPTDAIRDAKEKAKGRKFTQSVDLVLGLKQIDLKKPENTFTLEVELPSGRGKTARVGVIGTALGMKAKDSADVILDESALSVLEKDPKKVKKFVKDVDFLVAEAPLMIRIGKSLGKVLGPRGKMPKPFPPQADITPVIKKLKNSVKLSLKTNPSLSCTIGLESMPEDALEKNLLAVLHAVEKKLPLGKQNMGTILVKGTMGAPVKVEY